MIRSDYVVGTITLTNGSAAFTGTGTGWAAADFREGDTIIDVPGTPYQGVVDTITGAASGTLTKAWEGPTVTAAYRMRYQPDGSRVTAQARQLIELLGNGVLLAMADLAWTGGQQIVALDGAGSAILINKTDLTNGAFYNVQVANLAARAAYDGMPGPAGDQPGYAVFVADVGDGRAAIYSKLSDTSADWSAPGYVTGPVGPGSTVPGIIWQGPYNGATLYAINDGVTYNGSSFRKLTTAAAGTAPSGATPPIDTTDWEVLAAKGLNGTGVVGSVVAGSGILVDSTDPTAPIVSAIGQNKNLFHNPVFRTFQRGPQFTSTTVPPNNDGNYLIDGVVLLSDGNDIVDVSRMSLGDPVGAVYVLGLDVETVNKKFGIFMPIETLECWDIIGSTATLSFDAKVSSVTKLDNLKAAIVSWTGSPDAPTKDMVSAWNVEGTNPTLVANWTYENAPVNLNPTTSFQKFSISAPIDTVGAVNVGIFIWSDVTDTTLGDFLYITNVKLEKGSKATPCVPDPLALERTRCFRYLYRRSALSATDILGMMQAVSTSLIFGGPFVTFPVPMRVVPTVTRSDISHLGTYAAAGSGPSNISAGNFLATDRGVSSLTGLTVSGSPMSVGQGAMLIFSNSSGWIEATAEIGV